MDRNQFENPTVGEVNQQEAKYARGGDFITLRQPVQMVRVYPPHPNSTERVFYVFKSVNFMPIEVDDPENEGQKKIAQKPILNPETHSSIVNRNIVGEFITFVKNSILPQHSGDKERSQEIWAACVGSRKDGKFDSGIKNSDCWLVYADVTTQDGIKKFGTTEIKKSVKSHMNRISQERAVAGQLGMQTPNPFTDTQKGIRLVVEYDKDSKKADEFYNCHLEQIQKDEFNYELVTTPLEDVELEAFMLVDPLFDRYNNVYTRRDFMNQIEGLQRIDEKHKMGVFASEDWMQIVGDISELVDKLPDTSVDNGVQVEESVVTTNESPSEPEWIKTDQKSEGELTQTLESSVAKESKEKDTSFLQSEDEIKTRVETKVEETKVEVTGTNVERSATQKKLEGIMDKYKNN